MTPRGIVLVALGMSACLVDGSIGRDELASQGSGGGDGMGEGTSTAGTDGSDTDADGSGGGSGSGAGSGTTVSADGTDTGTDTGEGTTGVPPLCEPGDTDSECAICRRSHCCDEIIHCHDEAGCACYWDCLAGGDTPAACHVHCAYDGAAFDDLIACQIDQCMEVCGEHPEAPLPD